MSRKIALIGGLSLLALAHPAYSQAAKSGGAAPGGLEEIVVTAQKREQNLQSVPVSVTALSSEAIANNRITEFTDLTRAAPSLTLTQTSQATNNAIILRGIGTFAFSTGVEPSVAVIVDDMPVVQQAQAFDNLNDLQRIEVLKGPQGTLFGKNASAGVVNIVTKDPAKSFEGSLSVTGATDRDLRTEGSVSLPLAEGTGIRVTGFYHKFPGNVYNLNGGQLLNDQESYGVRAKLKTELGSAVTFTLSGSYNKTNQDRAGNSIRLIAGTGTARVLGSPALPLSANLTGITPGDGNFQTRVDTLGGQTNETATVSGRFNVNLGFANLISVTSYQDWKYNFLTDVDGTALDVLAALTGGAAHGSISQSGPYHSRDFTQEVRLVSSGSSALKYMAGIFYANAKTDRSFTRGPVVLLANWSSQSTNESLGLFAQLEYKLPTNTTVTGGLRYNHEKIGVSFDNLLASATANTCATGNPLCRGTNSDNAVTWKASVAQELAPHVMVFGSVATGYKGYAYDISSGFNPARVNAALDGTGAGLAGVGPVKPEKSTSFELGMKSRFLDNRVQLNVVGFIGNYNNFQAQSTIVSGSPPVGQLQLNNVGKLKTKGVEVEFTAKASGWLRIDAGAAYTDAIMSEYLGAPAYSGQTGQVWNGTASALVGPCTTAAAATAANPRTTCSFQNLSGARLPNSPKFKWNIGATANFPITGQVKGTAILSYQHQSDVNFDISGNPYLTQPAYGVLNASLGAEAGRVKLTVFVNNLFDKHFAANLGDSFSLMGGSATNDAHVITQYYTRDAQRYGGLKLTVSF